MTEDSIPFTLEAPAGGMLSMKTRAATILREREVTMAAIHKRIAGRTLTASVLESVLTVFSALWILAPSAAPVQAQTAIAIAAGGESSCAVTSAGGPVCWGSNWFGQLGDNTSRTSRFPPAPVTGLSSGVTAIAAGEYYYCALTSGGAVRCWGANLSGQLGDGSTVDRLTPVTVSGLGSGATAIAVGYYHACALTSSGAVLCWGNNDDGQLGSNTTTSRSTPVAVSGLGSVVAIAAGGFHTCAITSSGGVKCWGQNFRGQLGDNSTVDSRTPVAVSGLANGVKAISAGLAHTCALTTVGGALCWGSNASGQMGDNSATPTPRPSPVAVNGMSSGVTAIAAGRNHTCAIASTLAFCWGANARGQLGDGTTTQRLTPAAVNGLGSGVTAISVATHLTSFHTCALMNSGALQCWGDNFLGQLGNGSGTISPVVLPVGVVGFGGGGSAPNGCSISGAPAGSVAPGTALSLTVSCSGGNQPISCAWNVGPNGSCMISVSPTTTTTYTATLSNAIGSAAVSVTVTVVAAPPGTVPANCAISQSPSTASTAVAPGTIVTLSVTCSSGGAPTACAWTAGITSTSCSVSYAAPSSTNYVSATPRNASGTGAQTQTVVYVIEGSVPGNCSINASPGGTVAPGTPVTLTLSCTAGNPLTGCTWTAVPNASACTVTVSPSTTTTYTATPSNATGSGSAVSVTVTVVAAPSGSAPSSCTIGQVPDTTQSPVQPGTEVRLTLSCASGSPVTSCAWSGAGSPTTCSGPITAPAADVTYTATAINAFGSSASASTRVRIVSSKIATTTTITNLPLITVSTLGTATVRVSVTAAGPGTPSGTVIVSDGSSSCTIVLASATSCNLSPSSAGAKTVRATYGGDAIFATSTSAGASLSVTGVTNVPQIPTAGGNGNASIDVGNCTNCTLTRAEFVDTADIPVAHPNPNLTFPFGLADFTINVCDQPVAANPKTVTVTITLPPVPGGGGPGNVEYWKFGHRSGAVDRVWYRLSNFVPLGDTRVQLTLTDGKDGEDDDLAVNCKISDPIGLAVPVAKVVEFYNTPLDSYFITANAAEQAAIDRGSAGPGWSRTGGGFLVGGASSVCRFYGSQTPGPNSHFYTIDAAECQALKNLQATTPASQKRWNFESNDFVSTPPVNGVCPSGRIPVYRAYNNGFARGVDSNHRITANQTALNQTLSRGWKNEGVVMCAPADGGGDGTGGGGIGGGGG